MSQTLKFGATTPSYDLESEEDGQFDITHISRDLLDGVLAKFIGTINQVPPEYSAVKINGKRAYEYARRGISVEIKSKVLEIKEIEVLSFNLPEVKLRIVCGKGTYIRAPGTRHRNSAQQWGLSYGITPYPGRRL